MPARLATWLAATMAVALVTTACDSPRPSPSATPGASPGASAAAVVATVVATPGAVLLTAPGQTAQLAAAASAADGTAMAGTATWASSDLAVATVDGSGLVTAVAAVGTATVTATIGGVASPPVYVTVAEPVGGAVLLTDDQIVDGPIAVDPAAEPAADNAYEVTLSGVAGVEAGAILINTGEKTVAGRVVSTTPAGGGTRVRLVVVPPGELFEEVDFEDTVDLGTGPYEIPAELAAAYDVVQSGNQFTFTPKGTTGAAPRLPLGDVVLASWVGPVASNPLRRMAEAQGTVALPPLPPFGECEAEAGFGSGLPVPVRLSAPPSFTMSATGTATRQATAAGTRIVVQGTPTFTFETGLEIKTGFEAKVECKATLVTRKFRVPGWAGLFFGGDVEFGVGVELSGKVTLVSAKVGGKAELKPTFQASLDCPTGGECALGGSVTAETKAEPVLEAPSLNQAKFEPGVNLFGFIELEAGNADIDALQFEAIEAKAGVELAASLTLEALQIDDTNAETGKSKYELTFKGEVGPAVKLGEFLEYLGLGSANILKLEFKLPLGDSPTGAVITDRAAYLPGESGTVTVTLDPGSTVFPSSVGTYNVNRVVVAIRDGLMTEVVGSVEATEGQTTFEVPITVTGLVDADELYAFVVTSLLPLDPPKLEIGQGAFRCTENSPATIQSIGDDPDKIYVEFDGESGCRLVAEVGESHFPGEGPNLAISIDTDPGELGWDAEDTDQEEDGRNWQAVSGFAQDIPAGTRTFRTRHVPTGVLFEITVTVRIELIGGGPNTRMTVSDVKITSVHQ